MGQTAVEKILARAAGKPAVKAGDIVWVVPDLVTLPDGSILNALGQLEALGLEKPYDPSRIVVVSDHRVFINNDREAEIAQRIRGKVCDSGFCRFFEGGRYGLTHQLPVEKGLVLPGMLVVSLDTQATTLGGVGALAVPLNADVVFVLATGSVWMMAPRTVKVRVSGKKARGVEARDLALHLLKTIGWETANYRAIEFEGPAIKDMTVDERMTLCNGVVQIGAKAGFVAADERTLDYLKNRTDQPLSSVFSDVDAEYEACLEADASAVEPQVAVPPSPDNAVPVHDCVGKRVDWAYIAGCASARIQDLRAAAAVLRGRQISERVRMVVSPASQEILLTAYEEGLIRVFVEAGAMVLPPSCAPCYGGLIHLADGEVCIGTGTRNEPGRMGSDRAEVYIASPATVAASAVAGKIADPRDFLA